MPRIWSGHAKKGLEPQYLACSTLADRLLGAPFQTLVLGLTLRPLGAAVPCRVISSVLLHVADLPTSAAALEGCVAFPERVLLRQRQWCDVVLYTDDDDDHVEAPALQAIYEMLVVDKLEALEIAPPELLAETHDKAVYLLSGGLDAFRVQYPALCDVQADGLGPSLGDYSPPRRPTARSPQQQPQAVKALVKMSGEVRRVRGRRRAPPADRLLRMRGDGPSCDDDIPVSGAPAVQLPDIPSLQERMRVAHQRVFRSLQSSQLFRAESPSKVISHLYLGSAQNAAMWSQLQAFRVTHILVVGTECKQYFPGHFQYLQLEVWDEPEDQRIRDCLDPTFDFIDAARAEGSTVLVHCFCGISRSAAVVLAYLMRARGMPLQDALAFLQCCRPRVNPNSGFLDCLEKYGGELQGKASCRSPVAHT